MRHITGIYNLTWTDMLLCHGPAGAVRVATDYHQRVKWALCFALSVEVLQNVCAMSNTEQDTSALTIKSNVKIK